MKDILETLLQGQDDSRTYESEDEILEPLAEELLAIDDESILDFCRSMLYHADPSFWIVPAGGMDEDLPPDAHDYRGNVIQIKRVVRFCQQLAVAYQLDVEEMDILVAASLLHTITKVVEINDILTFDPFHPYSVDRAVIMRRQADEPDSSDVRSSTLWVENEVLLSILRLIRVQKGIWSPIPETIPETTLEWIFHTATLMAGNVHHMIDGAAVKEWRWKEPEDGDQPEISS